MKINYKIGLNFNYEAIILSMTKKERENFEKNETHIYKIFRKNIIGFWC